MVDHYFVDKETAIMTDETHFNWLVVDSSNLEEIEEIVKEYQLPKDLFIGNAYPEEVSRVERLSGTTLRNALSLIVIDLSSKRERIEKRLTPISFTFSDELLITSLDRKINFVEHLIKKYPKQLTSFEKIITYAILDIYTHYVKELKEMKKTIDALDQEARKTTENKELYRQADLERDVVYIDHTLKDQRETLDNLWDSDNFIQRLADERLLFDVRLRQRQTEKMIVIYRDLLESIGDLFSGMMDNNLNHLMKYLDSTALIISIPAMIAGIWGMNTGGLPGKSSTLGFLLVVIGAIAAAVAVGYYLFKKDYTK